MDDLERSLWYEECVICSEVSTQQTIAFVEPCIHSFCFDCVKQWCDVRPNEPLCPLCKRNIEKIIHDVSSPQTYKVFVPRPPPTAEDVRRLDTALTALVGEIQQLSAPARSRVHELSIIRQQATPASSRHARPVNPAPAASSRQVSSVASASRPGTVTTQHNRTNAVQAPLSQNVNPVSTQTSRPRATTTQQSQINAVPNATARSSSAVTSQASRPRTATTQSSQVNAAPAASSRSVNPTQVSRARATATQHSQVNVAPGATARSSSVVSSSSRHAHPADTQVRRARATTTQSNHQVNVVPVATARSARVTSSSRNLGIVDAQASCARVATAQNNHQTNVAPAASTRPMRPRSVPRQHDRQTVSNPVAVEMQGNHRRRSRSVHRLEHQAFMPDMHAHPTSRAPIPNAQPHVIRVTGLSHLYRYMPLTISPIPHVPLSTRAQMPLANTQRPVLKPNDNRVQSGRGQHRGNDTFISPSPADRNVFDISSTPYHTSRHR